MSARRSNIGGANMDGELQRSRVLGVPIDRLDMRGTIAELRRHMDLGGHHHHVGVNASKLVMSEGDPELSRILKEACVVSADGMSVVWASRALRQALPERVTGIDLMTRLLDEASEEGWRIFLLGARQEVVDRLATRLTQAYPQLEVAGTHHGYWDSKAEDEVVRKISGSNTDVLFIALPSPQKEYFVDRNRDDLNVRLSVGVGGSFDVLCGDISRAPQWMQRHGLEWAHRLAKEPRRLWRRYLIGNTQFMGRVLREARAHGRRP